MDASILNLCHAYMSQKTGSSTDLNALPSESKRAGNSCNMAESWNCNGFNEIDVANLKDYLNDEDGIDFKRSELHECHKSIADCGCGDSWLISHNLDPHSGSKSDIVKFYLFKHGFRDCGQQIGHTDCSFYNRNLNKSIPTRILIHGWMSPLLGSFNRDIRNAYLFNGKYNIIICDWSNHSADINYIYIIHLIETVGSKVANFTRKLHEKAGINYDDIYVIGHSLGAQIAGAAAEHLKPHRYNTIFALDPAGPKIPTDIYRINSDAACYVEAIQTSRFGFAHSNVNSTFYPNYSFTKRNVRPNGVSHIRSYKLFAESITSRVGFSGIRCNRSTGNNWECDENVLYGKFRMGGDPSIRKSGIFYVETNAVKPYAIG
uniref:Lipase domain-containing protein n=1 Tax=Glossina austeni TaxID=7395 RepID=A0A1A9VV04_GLOAU